MRPSVLSLTAVRLVLPLAVGLASCVCSPPPQFDDLADLDPSEEFPGGDTTNKLLMGSNAFISPASNLSPENEALFFSGNSWFNQSWVIAPASATTRDGLGPLYNAVSCSSCHFKDGRGRAFSNDGVSGVLMRISRPGQDADGESIPDPHYGTQLQDHAIGGVMPEGTLEVRWEERPGKYADGTSYSLRYPTYTVKDWNYGEPADDLLMSPRVATSVIGMGLLEAISEEDIEAMADPDDLDGDGISGRINWVPDIVANKKSIGRFGWKAEQPTVGQQVASAFSGDIGITTPLFPESSCASTQSVCDEQISGGEPEIDDRIFHRIEVYSQTIAVPVRRGWQSEELRRGKKVFQDLGCNSCHRASYTTGEHPTLDELSNQKIWPYTDLLLHDLGPELADNRPSYSANGREWRTAPLWGLGLVRTVNKHNHLMHDGRARGFAEAILWHGGEAEDSRAKFVQLDAEDRRKLLQFLGSL